MAPHSSTLAWKIPWTEEPSGLQSMGSLSRTWLSNFTFTFHFHALEKEMATHSSVLAWRIPGMGEPGGLPSMGSHRVGHDWSNLAASATLWKESYEQPRQHIKKQRHYFSNKCPSNQGNGFSSSHVWKWEFDYKESWTLKNCCFLTEGSEKTLQSSLYCKEIQPVHPKGDQSWLFIGRTDAEAETPILRPPDAKSWLIWKGPDAGKDWGQEEKGTTEDETVGWHHWLNGHGFE